MDKINSVIAGDYLGANIVPLREKLFIAPDFTVENVVEINKLTVDSYSVVDEDQRKNAASAVSRAAIGGMLVGAAGLFAGLSAKNKRAFTVQIFFKDSKKSMILLDEKNYAILMKVLF